MTTSAMLSRPSWAYHGDRYIAILGILNVKRSSCLVANLSTYIKRSKLLYNVLTLSKSIKCIIQHKSICVLFTSNTSKLIKMSTFISINQTGMTIASKLLQNCLIYSNSLACFRIRHICAKCFKVYQNIPKSIKICRLLFKMHNNAS